MAWKLAYFDEVAMDVEKAKKWYFERQKGLEKRFAQDIKECLSRIKKEPLHYEIRYKQVRLAHCEIFPYSIHFYINDKEKQITITAIVHQRRNPKLAQKRK